MIEQAVISRFALGVAALIALGTPGPALAATAEQLARARLVASLPADVSRADRRAAEAALALPAGVTFSRSFVDRAVPGWRGLAARAATRARAERATGPWHQVATRLTALRRQIRPAPPVPALPPFGLSRYRAGVAMLSGQGSLPWPGDAQRKARFTSRLMGHPGNQLGELCDFLAAYYRQLGLTVEEQEFSYEGKPYRNVAAIIPGRSPERVLLVDHFDVAPTADYDHEALAEARAFGLGSRQIAAIRGTHRKGWPVPGADDNASATAALMEAAHVLAPRPAATTYRRGRPGRVGPPAKTIVLLHLNGEEFPGDSYGAKQYVARALSRREPIAAVVVMDMIGSNRTRDRVFQIAAGQGAPALHLADLATRAAGRVAHGYQPAVRLFDDHRSYLYNTDGQVFSAAGYPTILLNEHLNYHEDLERLGYHDEFDRTELIDWPYARAIASVGMLTAVMATREPPLYPALARELPLLQEPERRVSHFQIELRYSPLYEAMARRERKLRRTLDDAELAELIRRDLDVEGDPAQHDTSMARRLTTWFPQAGLAPMDFPAIAGELRYLRARNLR